jgi:hypothetical protein
VPRRSLYCSRNIRVVLRLVTVLFGAGIAGQAVNSGHLLGTLRVKVKLSPVRAAHGWRAQLDSAAKVAVTLLHRGL